MALAALLLDYLFVQSLLEAKLTAALDLPVKPIEQLAQLETEQLAQDCVFVMWFGDRFPDDAGNGRSTMVGQQWLIVLGVRNASQHDKAARNSSAGPLLSKVHAAVSGWSPEGAHRPFKRIAGPRPSYRANAAMYPLAFEILLNL